MTIQSTDALTPARMRRLAAAIDGEAPGEERWVVMSEGDPYVVAGCFPTVQQANDALRAIRSTRHFLLFGPFANARPQAPLAATGTPVPPMPPGCIHVRYSEMICYPPPLQFSRIVDARDSLVLDNPVTGGRIAGSAIDAIFFDRNAFKTFAHPHLVAVHGLGGALSYLSERGAASY